MQPETNHTLSLTSPVFGDGEEIPRLYTCKGEGISPPLNISGVPSEAKSLTLIMHDPDAPNGDFTHWIVWDIPSSTYSIAANTLPVGAMQGKNSAGQLLYFNPCPPAGTGKHHYIFELYALDASLGLLSNDSREGLEVELRKHLIAKTHLTGVVQADN